MWRSNAHMPAHPNSQLTPRPLVSVWIITYNQEQYLPLAIDSALGQKTDFEFEIVIGEDCSHDKTRDVCLRYQKAHPEKIRLLLHEDNQGLVRNFWETLQLCREVCSATRGRSLDKSPKAEASGFAQSRPIRIQLPSI